MIRTLVKRHMLLFFKDKTAVFFSFMAVFVVLGLYVSFLGDMMIQPLKVDFPNTARELSDTWIMAGTLGIVSLTTSLSVLGIIIEDKSKRIVQDFYVSPITSLQLTISYILSTICITFMVSLITLLIGQLYIVAYGGHFISLITLCKLLGIMLLCILSCTSMLYFFMSFFQSSTSFSNVTTIIGTLSGFLMGIYVPIGSLPNVLQIIISYFPPSHCALLYRNLMMEDVLNTTFTELPQDALIAMKEQFGLQFSYGNHLSTMFDSIMILCGMAILFLILSNRRKQRMK